MSRRLFGCAIAGALMLAGCATEPVIVDSHADVTTRMANIASRFEQARHEGGEARSGDALGEDSAVAEVADPVPSSP